MAEVFSFKSDQDSLAKLIWIVLRPVRIYQDVVSKRNLGKTNTMSRKYPVEIENPESRESLPGLDH